MGGGPIWSFSRENSRTYGNQCEQIIRMSFSGMLHRVALVRTDFSEELSASIIRVTRIDELGTTLAVTSILPSSPILVTLMMEVLRSSETSILTRSSRRNISEDAILNSHRRENLKSYTEKILSQPRFQCALYPLWMWDIRANPFHHVAKICSDLPRN
jgi:hypothetical protein